MSHDSPPAPNHHVVGDERHLAAREGSEASVAVLLASDPTIATMPADDDDSAAVPSGNSRKQTDKAVAAGSGGASGASKSQARKRGRKGPNKWVYITCLSEDTTEQELIELAARYGVLQPDLETGHPRVKLYRDESGKCKGDATVAYLKPESVALACELLDGYFFKGKPIHVEEAKFEMKEGNDDAAVESGAAGSVASTGATVAVAKKKKSHKALVREQLLKHKLSWNEGVDESAPKIIVIKGMFVPSDFVDPSFDQELESDIVQGCGVYGDIDKITVFSKHPEGVVIIKYKDAYAAEQCVTHTHGRFFAGRQLACDFWAGEDFSTPEDKQDKAKKVEEEEKRMQEFGDWLENASSDSEDDVVTEEA